MITSMSQEELVEEITEIAHEMLDEIVATAGVESVGAVANGVDRGLVEVTVDILGGEAATLTLRLEVDTAIGLTSALIGTDASVEDACGTAAEFANVLAGSMKSLLDEETALDVPNTTTVSDTPLGALDGGVVVNHTLGTFELRVA